MRPRRVLKVDAMEGAPFSSIGNEENAATALYIVRPNYLDEYDPKKLVVIGGKKYPAHSCFRCGSVGTKEFTTEKDPTYHKTRGSVKGRMAMYESNWLTGGRIYGLLVLNPKTRTARNRNRQDRNTEGEGFVKWIESQFHDEIEVQGGERITRGCPPQGETDKRKPSEWFYGDVMNMIKALRNVSLTEDGESMGRIVLYGDHTFKGRAKFASEVILRSSKGVTKHWEPQDHRLLTGARTRSSEAE